jgi:hypothetical protein
MTIIWTLPTCACIIQNTRVILKRGTIILERREE